MLIIGNYSCLTPCIHPLCSNERASLVQLSNWPIAQMASTFPMNEVQWALEVSSLFDNKCTNRRIKKERRQHEAANWNKCLPLSTKNIRLLIVCMHHLFPKTFKWTETQRDWKVKTQRSLRFGLFCVIWVTSISWLLHMAFGRPTSSRSLLGSLVNCIIALFGYGA